MLMVIFSFSFNSLMIPKILLDVHRHQVVLPTTFFSPRPPDDFEKGNLSANVNVKSLKYTGHFRNDGSMTTQLHLVRTVMPCLFKDPYLWSSSDRANRKCKHLNSQTRCEAHTNEK